MPCKKDPVALGVLLDWLEDQGYTRSVGSGVMELLARRYGYEPVVGRRQNDWEPGFWNYSYCPQVWNHYGHRFVTSGRKGARLFYIHADRKQRGGPRGKEVLNLAQLEELLTAVENSKKEIDARPVPG